MNVSPSFGCSRYPRFASSQPQQPQTKAPQTPPAPLPPLTFTDRVQLLVAKLLPFFSFLKA